MRHVPQALRVKLDEGATTLCRCWLVTRRDGLVQGFTDHDENVPLGATLCLAGTGLDASEATTRLGLQVDGQELSGALAHDSLTDLDLAAGRYDGACVETWLVDWSDPEVRMPISTGRIGEVRREGAAFVAEVRSAADRLSQQSGRLYTKACAADLGDARCKVDLSLPTRRAVGAVTATISGSTFRVSGCDAFANGAFTGGRFALTSGADAGVACEVKTHAKDQSGVTVTLWQAMPQPIAVGDAFVMTVGCDKRFATCRDRFANTANFRGFPHIPGNDFVIRHP